MPTSYRGLKYFTEWNIIRVEFCATHKIKTVVVLYVSNMEKPQRCIIKAKRNEAGSEYCVHCWPLLYTLVIYRYFMSF